MELIDHGIIIGLSRQSKTDYKINVLLKQHGHYSGFCSTYSHNLILGSIGKVILKVKTNHVKIKFYQADPSPSIYVWDKPILMATFITLCESAVKFIPQCIANSDDYNMFYTSLDLVKNYDYNEALFQWDRYLLSNYIDDHINDLPNSALDEHVKNTPQLNTRSRADLIIIDLLHK